MFQVKHLNVSSKTSYSYFDLQLLLTTLVNIGTFWDFWVQVCEAYRKWKVPVLFFFFFNFLKSEYNFIF